MGLFEFLMIFVSVVIGLGLTEIIILMVLLDTILANPAISAG